jgi:hypothetical protein
VGVPDSGGVTLPSPTCGWYNGYRRAAREPPGKDLVKELKKLLVKVTEDVAVHVEAWLTVYNTATSFSF